MAPASDGKGRNDNWRARAGEPAQNATRAGSPSKRLSASGRLGPCGLNLQGQEWFPIAISARGETAAADCRRTRVLPGLPPYVGAEQSGAAAITTAEAFSLAHVADDPSRVVVRANLLELANTRSLGVRYVAICCGCGRRSRAIAAGGIPEYRAEWRRRGRLGFDWEDRPMKMKAIFALALVAATVFATTADAYCRRVCSGRVCRTVCR